MVFQNRIKGVNLRADPIPDDASWIQRLLGRFLASPTIAVFQLPSEFATAGYKVGFRRGTGMNTIITKHMLNKPHFGVRLPRVPCIIYAVNLSGEEIPIKRIKEIQDNDPNAHSLTTITVPRAP